MKKVISSILVTIYVLISVFVTTCLLNYNDYNVTVLDDYSLIINGNNIELDDYKNGDLIVLKKEIENVKINDYILYYDTYANQVKVEKEIVTNVEKVNDSEYTYTLGNGNPISSQYLIGSLNESKTYHLFGNILKLLTSRWGYLFIIILPMLILFIYEIYSFFKEIKDEKKNRKNN